MTDKHRHLTADYKDEVIRIVLGDGLRAADVCRGQGEPLTAEQQRIRTLEQENRQFKEDMEILKKHRPPSPRC